MEHFQTQVIYELTENPANPNIHHKTYQTEKQHEYNILTYDKNMICADDTDSGKYRSVIFSQGKLVCFAPPKSLPKNTFIRNHPEQFVYEPSVNQIPETIHITETMEGTMINLFYDGPNKTWEIATKNAVGGRYWYFRNNYNGATATDQRPLTFRDMFLEAIGEADYMDLNQTKLVANLPINCCYSFVLQHPQNHIVHEVDRARVFLVAMYKIRDNTARYISVPYMMNLTAIRDIWAAGLVHFSTTIQYSPHLYRNTKFPISTFDNLLCSQGLAVSPKNYFHLEQHLNYCGSYEHMVGLTLIDTESGERTKLENQRYAYKKQLRGNHPNLQYQYLCLWRIQKVPEFLRHFPVYTDNFQQFEAQMDQFVNQIQTVYYMRYVKKQVDMEYSKHIMYFAKRIHNEVFIPSLKTMNRVVITRPVVRSWLMREFEPSALLYHMNMREPTVPYILPSL